MAYLKRRGNTYYAQMRVPLDLRPQLGANPLQRSLRTKHRPEAQVRALDVVQEWNAMFAQLRSGAAPRPASTPSAAAKTHYAAELSADERERHAGIMRFADSRAFARGVYANKLRLVSAGLITGDEAEALIGYALNAQDREGRLTRVEPGTGDRAGMLRGLAAVQLDALAVAEAKDNGNVALPEPKSELLLAPEPEAPKEGEGILDLFDRYAAENAKGISADTLKQARRDVKLFADNVGNPAAPSITKKHVRAWKDLLLAYPVKAAEIAVFRGLDMKAVVEKNRDVGKPVISDGTVNRHLSALGAFCDWLVRNDFLDRNPTEGLFQFIDKTARHKPTFTAEQMNTFFVSSLFTGALSDEEWRKPGKRLIRDHRFWIPLVMLFAGARPAEIAQLGVGDVRELHGVPVIHITEEGDDGKSVKTKGSMRVVPVHPELIRLGLLRYCDDMAAKGEKRLFPKAERNTRGQMVADFSRDFGRFLGKLGIREKTGKGHSLYSFRHGFADALRSAGFLDEQIGPLMGHTAHTMTGQYGHLPQGTLKQRVEMIEAVAYPGLNIGHLQLDQV